MRITINSDYLKQAFIAFIAILAVFTSSFIFANELTLDPTKEGESTFIINCVFPAEREPNSQGVSLPLPIDEIATVNFFARAGSGSLEPAGTNDTDCKQVYDLTNVADGVYTYIANVTDTDGRTSIMSGTWVELTVKREAVTIPTAKPRPPMNMIGSGI